MSARSRVREFRLGNVDRNFSALDRVTHFRIDGSNANAGGPGKERRRQTGHLSAQIQLIRVIHIDVQS